MLTARARWSTDRSTRIVVVGGGIGGLTVAAALVRKGFDVHVVEAAPSYADVGGGHWLYVNALDALDRIDPGIVDDLTALGAGFDGFLFTDRHDRRLLFEGTAPYGRAGRAPLVLHRKDIIEQLARRVPADRLHFGRRLAAVRDGQLVFEDGSTMDAPVIVGADGIHSRVRRDVLTTRSPRFSGQVGLWGIGPGPLPAGTGRLFQEMWGDGIRFGFTNVGASGVYWFMVVRSAAEGIPAGPADRKAFVLARAKDFPDALQEVVRRTDATRIQTNPLYDVTPLWRWHTESVCVIGDAAHACTPNLGQGGCQAIEDGYWLAEMLDREPTPARAFAAFQRKRWWRVAVVVFASRWLGRFAQSSGWLGWRVRNALVWMTPAAVLRPVLRWIMTPRG